MPPRQQLVQCDSLRTLECELDSIRDKLAIPESEETWDTIAKAVLRFTSLIQNGASNFPNEVANGLRSISRSLNHAVLSERSRLSGAAIDLLKAAAEGIGKAFDALIPVFVPTLLILCSRSNKVFITRAKACLINIIETTQAPTILSYLAEAAKDKSLSLRLSAAEGGLACLNSFNPPDLEKDARAREVEALIKATATDASADIRKVGRQLFEAYKILLPHRVDSFTSPLTPTTKKYLDIRSRAPSASTSNPPSRPASSQSTHSANGTGTGPSRPKPILTKSSTTLFATASGSKPSEGPQRPRTISTITGSGPGLTRSESAPSTSTSHSTSAITTTTSNAAPLRPPVGPSRARPPVVPAAAQMQKGPSRPTASRDMPPPATIPIRPQAPTRPSQPQSQSHSPEPNPFAPADQKATPLKTSGGPLRPNATVGTGGASGPSRVAQEVGEQKQRVMGGARRVLLPEPAPQPAPPPPPPPQPAAVVAEVKKVVATSGHSRTSSNASSVDPAPPPSKPARTDGPPPPTKVNPSLKKADPPTGTKTKARAPPAPSAAPRKRPDSSVSTSTITTTHHTTNTTTHHTTATTTSRRNATTTTGTTSSRLTEPTQSQRAKTKPVQGSKPIPSKKNEVAKPVGRPISTRGTTAAPPAQQSAVAAAGTKGGVGGVGGVTTRKRVVSTVARPTAAATMKTKTKTTAVKTETTLSPEVAVAAAIPLPQSPCPASSALPGEESPTIPGSVEALGSSSSSPGEEDTNGEKASSPLSSPPGSSSSHHEVSTEDVDDIKKPVEDETQDEPTIVLHHPPEDDVSPQPSQDTDSSPNNDSEHPPSPPSPPSPQIQISPSTPTLTSTPSTPRPSNQTPNPLFPTPSFVPETPISSLLESIQRGFDFSPAPPFDPDQSCAFGGGGMGEDEGRCEPLHLVVGERRPLRRIG